MRSKAARFALMLAGVMAVLGLVLLLTGSLMGGREELDELAEARFGELSAQWRGHSSKSPVLTDPVQGEELSGFHSVEATIDLGDIRFQAGETPGVELTGKVGGYELKYTVENDTLWVWSEAEDRQWWDQWEDMESLDIGVTITMPSSTDLKDLTLDSELGDIQVEWDGDARDVVLSTELGDIQVDWRGSARTVDISTDMGNLTCQGLAGEAMEVESDLGDVTVSLPGPKDDYGWELEASLGEITVDGKSVTGEAIQAGGSGKRYLKASTDMGDLEVTFS